MRVSRATVRQLTSLEVAHSAADLVDLQRVAYKREAELIGDDRIPQLSESAADLVAAGLVWLVVENQGRFVAALGFEESSQEIGIDRLVVHPDSHRQGLGAAQVRDSIVASVRENILPSAQRLSALKQIDVSAPNRVVPHQGVLIPRHDRIGILSARQLDRSIVQHNIRRILLMLCRSWDMLTVEHAVRRGEHVPMVICHFLKT